MAEIIRNRVIRPSSRLATSKNYKIDTKGVNRGDSLKVNITHEKKEFYKTFYFKGDDLYNKDSISFSVKDSGVNIEIHWANIQPLNTVGAKR
jgi:hypothetical protein